MKKDDVFKLDNRPSKIQKYNNQKLISIFMDNEKQETVYEVEEMSYVL